jgi:hypothetical protein
MDRAPAGETPTASPIDAATAGTSRTLIIVSRNPAQV